MITMRFIKEKILDRSPKTKLLVYAIGLILFYTLVQVLISCNILNDYYEESIELRKSTIKIDLGPEEEFIYNIIKDNPPHIHADDLIIISNYDFGKLSNTIFMLELKDMVKKIEGNKYVCCN